MNIAAAVNCISSRDKCQCCSKPPAFSVNMPLSLGREMVNEEASVSKAAVNVFFDSS